MAETKNNKNPLGIPQTRGSWQLGGFVTGTGRNEFYSEKNTTTNKPRRVVNFAVQFNEDTKHYVQLSGMEQKSVFFSGPIDEATKKRKTVEVPWRERKSFEKEGYSMIGVRIGLETRMDEKGNEKTDTKTMHAFDACEYVSTHMKDNMPVYVRGNLTYSTYKDQHRKNFEVNQISASSRTYDFADEKFEPVCDFTQRIIYMGIRTDEENPNRWILSGKVVGYNSVEDVEFPVVDKRIAVAFRKGLKPYNAIDIYGHISVSKNEEEATENENGLFFGKGNPMKKNSSTVIELICDGAEIETLDTDEYNEDNVDEAIRKAKSIANAKKDYGDNEEESDDPIAKNFGSGAKIKPAADPLDDFDFDEEDL